MNAWRHFKTITYHRWLVCRGCFRVGLYKQGLTEFQAVLDAQRSLLTYQNYLVQAQGGSLIYLVQLYEALGGGW